MPADITADLCLSLLRAGRAVTYEVRESLQPGSLKIRVRDRVCSLPIPGAWSIVSKDAAGALTLEAVNLSGEQARSRVALLNAPGRPAGKHSLS